MCSCTSPRFHVFLCEMFFIVDGLVCFGMLGGLFTKWHTPYVVSSMALKTIDDNIMS